VRVRLNLAGERIGPQLERNSVKWKARINDAARGAAKDVVEYVEPKARADIRGAGQFGQRWSSGFVGKVTEGGGNIRVSFSMPSEPPMRHWRVFEFGAVIRGKPLLWIPLSFAKDAQGIRARDYPGKLFRVDRKAGAPLLLGGNPATPKYFGKTQVTIPKKFHLRDIIKEGAKQLKLFYSARMSANG
jgi:hypothetical protein